MKAPSGPRHARCELHVPHPYPSNGWLCMDDPSRAEDMRTFGDHLIEIVARHHAAELERQAASSDGTAVPITFSDRGACPSASSIRSRCVGHQCRALELIVPQPVRGPRVKARKPSPRTGADRTVARILAERATEPCVSAACTTPNDPSTHHGPAAHMRVTSADYTAAELASGDPDLRIRTTRPTCERCGQSFRLSGTGYAWHVQNRPNCKRT